MFAESFTNILFRLLNFAALMGLFAFIFKKYMYHDIEESIKHDQLEEININTRISEIDHRGSELSEEIIKQEKLCKHLVTRADQWNSAFEKEVKEKQNEQQALHKKIVVRAELQAQTIANERMIHAVLPKAIETARNKLTQSFASETKSNEFVQGIIAHMKKSL